MTKEEHFKIFEDALIEIAFGDLESDMVMIAIDALTLVNGDRYLPDR